MKSNEFQIIPKYFLERNFSLSLVEQLRIYKLKKVYCVVQNFTQHQFLVQELEQLCTHFEISIHYEKIDDEFVLNEQTYNQLIQNLSIGQPDVLIVIGAEKAINYAKLINYLINNFTTLKTFEAFTSHLDLPCEHSLKLYCILTDFTLGSENNFVGVLNTFHHQIFQRLAFNANLISTFIYAHEEFFNNLNEQQINYSIFGMFMRCLEQITTPNPFEFSKNYTIANLQTLLDFLDSSNKEKYHNELMNLIWTNVCINNGIANLLCEGDWKLHILAFELVDHLQININQALVLISISYLLLRSEKENAFKHILQEITLFLFANDNIHQLVNYLTKLKKAINETTGWKLTEKEQNQITLSALNKILKLSNLTDFQTNEIRSLFNEILTTSFNEQ